MQVLPLRFRRGCVIRAVLYRGQVLFLGPATLLFHSRMAASSLMALGLVLKGRAKKGHGPRKSVRGTTATFGRQAPIVGSEILE